MMEQSFPIWDKTGSFILLNEDGNDLTFTESEVRKMISRQQLGVLRGRNLRKIYLKDDNGVKGLPGTKRVDSAQPFCVKITVGDHYHTFMHVKERCESLYDGRPMPKRMDSSGNFTIPMPSAIDADCL